MMFGTMTFSYIDDNSNKTFKHECNNSKCKHISKQTFQNGFAVCPKCGNKTYVNILR